MLARSLTRRSALPPAGRLRALAAAIPDDAAPDLYGSGRIVEDLERETAALLGKPAAVFCTSGKAAQLSALRVHADARGRRLVAAHPRSHLVEDEDDAIGALYGLRVARVGALGAPFTAEALATVREPLAAAVVELPLRRAGYLATPWDELVRIAETARASGAAFHLDGARLWEAAPPYGRSPGEIAALADTVYVSFYKGLGGLAGAVLAGDEATVAAARHWIGRAGAILFRAFPYAVAAREGLRTELPRMPEYVAHAALLAAALRGIPGLRVSADPPACNAFAVYLIGESERLLAARDAVAAEHALTLFETLAPSALPRIYTFEVVVGAETLTLAPHEVRAGFEALLAAAL